MKGNREREREMGNEMEWLSTSTVIERAKEELEILETHHPNGFHYLKSELKIFISSFDSHNFSPLPLCDTDTAPLPTTSSALTQESSTSKKRKANRLTINEDADETAMPKIQKVGSSGYTKKIDAVLERAQQCIHKIRRFKATL
ncbi:uncharacterized protein LOC111401216 isoform X4 [Olea europaea var. sylvestris]|nr:uncharacterized protein LOC111401216 isoform X1 [Olea europaea var. sylvestris]XP_022884624.1 uncharacterized protein LOC111401216 isoform X4 [Olea europaea var. sylvestris]